MSREIDKKQVFSSLIWKLMERGGTQSIQFIVQIILARLLLPEDFGTIAIVLVFISLAQVFVQSGFNTALIQKKDADEVDFSSVFYLSLAVAGALYVLIYFMTPFVANFYGDQLLVAVLRVLSLTLFFGALNSIQNAYIAKNMMFKKLFFSSLGAMMVSGIFGIVAAVTGLGVWALVIQQLVNQLSISIILWFTVKWRPQLLFSFSRIKILFSFGSKLLASSLLNALYVDLRTLIIGLIYSPAMLGYYNRGQQFPKIIVTNIDGSLQSVMFPALSAHQNNRPRLRNVMRRAIASSSFLVIPMMVGLALVAEPLVEIVLTDKWLPSVPFLRIFCLSYILKPVHSANLQAINALGRSDIYLKLEITKKVIGIIILAVTIPQGVYAIAIGMAINELLAPFIIAYPNKTLLDYSYKEQFYDILPSLVISLIMGVAVYSVSYFDLLAWQTLITQIIVGVSVYVGLAKLLKVESFTYLTTIIAEMVKQRRQGV